MVELLKTKCTPILLCGLDACPVCSRQLRSLNHVVVSCGRKIVNVNTSEIAAGCIKMCVESMTLLTLWPRVKTNLLTNTVRYAVSLSSRISCFPFYFIFIQ